MKRILCAMAWLGICAALVGCTTSAIEGPETVSHHVDPSSSVSDPASSEDPGAYDGEFSLSVGEGALPAAPEEIVIQIHNGTDEEFSYGEAYWLERLSDSGKWEMLEYLPDTAWHDIGILSARTPRASTASTRSIIMGRKHSRKATTVMGIRLMGRRTMRSLILGRFEGERSRLFYK